MTPVGVMIELVERLGASPDRVIRIDSRELTQWPSEAVSALKAQKIIRKARPASATLCPGCEQQCAMPVYTVQGSAALSAEQPASFILCDRREDVNRVWISKDRLAQWRTSAGVLARFIADALSIPWKEERSGVKGVLEIGKISGDRHRQVLSLRTEGEMRLVSGSNTRALTEVFGFGEGRYQVDEILVHRLVNAPNAAEERYTASQIRRNARSLEIRERDIALQKVYQKLKRDRPDMSDVWYARQIARKNLGIGLSAETIRKKMKA